MQAIHNRILDTKQRRLGNEERHDPVRDGAAQRLGDLQERLSNIKQRRLEFDIKCWEEDRVKRNGDKYKELRSWAKTIGALVSVGIPRDEAGDMVGPRPLVKL